MWSSQNRSRNPPPPTPGRAQRSAPRAAPKLRSAGWLASSLFFLRGRHYEQRNVAEEASEEVRCGPRGTPYGQRLIGRGRGALDTIRYSKQPSSHTLTLTPRSLQA